MSLWLIAFLVFTHSAVALIFYLTGAIREADRVNRNWIAMDEWQRFTASPWGRWLRDYKRKRT